MISHSCFVVGRLTTLDTVSYLCYIHAMIGFLIKKTFFDMWDNLFSIFFLNIGFLAVVSVLIFFPSLFINNIVLFYCSTVVAILIVFVYTGMASRICRDISDYKTPQLRDVIVYLKETYIKSLLFGLMNTVFIFLLSIALPTYLNFRSFIGIIAFAFLFWVAVLWLVSSEYYFPVQARFEIKFKDSIKKVLLLFFDNTIFSLGLFLGVIVIFVASAFIVFLLPGITTIFLWLDVGLKLRLYKYDYLDENPSADRKKIPWDVLLIDDKDRVGKRTLKGFIFPWKDD